MRHFRAQRNLSQRKLAGAMGRDVTQVNGWECGRTIPSELSLGRIAEALGVSIDELRYGPGGHEPETQSNADRGSPAELLNALAQRLGVSAGQLKLTIELTV
jgi:transcriptional regulator with XRE-family HTH domain